LDGCEDIINGLQVPQLILNYKTGSADGISLAFLTVWLIGDATNLAGRSSHLLVVQKLHSTPVTLEGSERF